MLDPLHLFAWLCFFSIMIFALGGISWFASHDTTTDGKSIRETVSILILLLSLSGFILTVFGIYVCKGTL